MRLTGRDPGMSVDRVDCCRGGRNEGKWQTAECGGKGVSGCLGDTVRHWNMIGSRFIELGFSFQLQKKCSSVFYFVLHSVVFICHLSVWTFNGGQITYSVTVIQQCHSNFERWFYFLLFFPYKRGRNLHTHRHTRTWAVQLQCFQQNGLVRTEARVFIHSEEPLE